MPTAIRPLRLGACMIALALILGLVGLATASTGGPAERQAAIALADLPGVLRDGGREPPGCSQDSLPGPGLCGGTCDCGSGLSPALECSGRHLLARHLGVPPDAAALPSADLDKPSKPPRPRYVGLCGMQTTTRTAQPNHGYVSRFAMERRAFGRQSSRRRASEQVPSRQGHPIQVPLPMGMPTNLDPLIYGAATNIARDVRDGGLTRCRSAEDSTAAKIEALLNYLEGVVFRHGDAAVDGLVADASGGRLPVACRTGCAWCCHQDVDVSIPEAILIARRRAAAHCPGGRPSGAPAHRPAPIRVVGRARAGLPCPLLSEEKTCSVYAVRPFACRTLLSSDALRCEDALKSAVSGKADVYMKSYGVLQLVGCAHRAGINAITRELGLQHDDVSLVSALSQISDDKDTVERWMAGARVFTPRAGP